MTDGTSHDTPRKGRPAPALPRTWSDLVEVQHGVLTYAQAEAALGRGRVRNQVASGRWQRPCRGVVVTHNGPLTAEQTLWMVVLAAGPGTVVAGLTAAVLGGLRPPERPASPGTPGPDPIHLLIPGTRGYPDLGARLPGWAPPVLAHRTGLLPAGHLLGTAPTRTTLPRSIVDAAQWADDDDEAGAVVAAAYRQGLTDPAEIRGIVADMPRAHRRAMVLAIVDPAGR